MKKKYPSFWHDHIFEKNILISAEKNHFLFQTVASIENPVPCNNNLMNM